MHGIDLDTIEFEADLEELYVLIYDQADYVNEIADGDRTIILKAGFEVVTNEKSSNKNDESYTQGVSGQVKAVLKARNGASGYVWQYCVYDPAGEPVWILADVTRYAKFNYNGLTPGTKYMFRYSAVINNTMSDFSNPYIMIVT